MLFRPDEGSERLYVIADGDVSLIEGSGNSHASVVLRESEPHTTIGGRSTFNDVRTVSETPVVFGSRRAPSSRSSSSSINRFVIIHSHIRSPRRIYKKMRWWSRIANRLQRTRLKCGGSTGACVLNPLEQERK